MGGGGGVGEQIPKKKYFKISKSFENKIETDFTSSPPNPGYAHGLRKNNRMKNMKRKENLYSFLIDQF